MLTYYIWCSENLTNFAHTVVTLLFIEIMHADIHVAEIQNKDGSEPFKGEWPHLKWRRHVHNFFFMPFQCH